jgi:hypothetical protein
MSGLRNKDGRDGYRSERGGRRTAEDAATIEKASCSGW